MAIVSDVEIRLRADIARLQQDLNRARGEVNTAMGQMTRAVTQFKNVLASLGVGIGIGALIGQVITAQREFDKLNASLTAVTGSSRSAKEVFGVLQDFAAKTPYSVGEVTEAFLKLRNLGLTPSERALSSYGNTASAMGKDLNQLIEAVADAATGEFERLKEFGIKSKQQGDQVAFTFQGTTTTVKNSAEEIENYLMRIGEVNFAGAMALQADTLNGDLSALGDTWNRTLTAFATSGFGDAVRGSVMALSGALQDLQAMFKAVTGAAADEGAKVQEIGPIHKGLTTFFEAMLVVGTNVAYVFKTIGKDIGAFAAQAAVLFTGGFKGLIDGSTLRAVQAIGHARVAEAKEERRQVDETSAAILGAARKAQEARAGESKQQGDRLAGYKIESTAVAGLSDAQKKAAETAKKAESDRLKNYQSLIDAANAAAIETAREAEGLDRLTKSQQMAMALDAGLANGKIKLTTTEEAYYRALIESIGANEDTIKANEKAEQSAEAVRKAVEELDNARRQTIDSARTEAESAEQLVATFGMTAQAIELMTVKRLEDRLARQVDLELDEKEIAHLTDLIELKKRSASAKGQLAELEKTRDMWESIEKTAHDTFVSIMDGGKDAATRLKDTFKNIFFDWLYQQTLKKWIINLQGNASVDGGGLSSFLGGLGGAFSSGSSANGGGFMGSASGLISAGKYLYQGFSQGFGTLFSGGAGAAAGGGGASAGLMSNPVGWIVGGMMANDKFFKQGWNIDGQTGDIMKSLLGSTLKGNPFGLLGGAMTFGINQGNTLLKKVGLSDRWASLLSGSSLWARAFGRQKPTIDSQGIEGTISASGFSGQAFANILEKGGWFRSDKRYTKTAALDTDTQASFDSTITQMAATIREFGTALGAETSAIDGYNKQIKLTLGKDEEANQKLIAETFAGIGDDLANMLVPNLQRFSAEGETATTTLQRLAAEVTATDAIMTAMGVTAKQAFGVVGVASLDARERLIKFAGGIEALASQTEYFNANFLTEAERLAPIQKQVTEQMGALGYSSVTTVEQFKAAVLGLASSGALATEAGAKTYAALLALAPAFKTVADAARDSAAALAQATVDTLRKNADEAFQALQRSVDARKRSLAEAFDQAMAGVEQAIDKTSNKINNLQSLADALRGASDQVGGTGNRQVAQTEIQAALAIAKASGVLPSADSLRDALATVAGTQGQFSSLADFQRDQARTRNSIEELAGLTGTQLTTEQRQLLALEDQRTAMQKAYDDEIRRLDTMIEKAQNQLDAINGLNTSVLSLVQAFSQFASAIGGALANPTIGAQPSVGPQNQIEALYNSILGRNSDAAGMQFYIDQLANGVSFNHIRDQFYNSPEYKDLSGNTRKQSATMAGGDSAVLSELKTMNSQLAGVARATGATADILDNVTAGGDSMRVGS